VTADNMAWIAVRSLDEFAELRKHQQESPPLWWPDIGPIEDTGSFSFSHRMRRLGPITVLDVNFHHDVWVNGGDTRPHYHVTLPVATSVAGRDGALSVVSKPGSVAVHRPEGKACISRYVGRLLAVMIDRHAVEDALAAALGRSITSQIDCQPTMVTTTQPVHSWISMVSLFAEQLFQPDSALHLSPNRARTARKMLQSIIEKANGQPVVSALQCHPYRRHWRRARFDPAAGMRRLRDAVYPLV
jgi:hypothetical protein